ncbi:MAG: 3-hydroxyacyl-CoA dehydrogenase family protein [Elusimicrobiales bacterium]|nr:3-hydroxyacyl-CoA dehydrogenase family protein [Elusimicrobiales bacterium]
MDIKNIGIAGAGIMGSSMGQIFASYGYKVVIYDLFEKALEPARQRISQALDALVSKNEMMAEQKKNTLSRISFSSDMKSLKDCDFLVECVVEDMGIKHKFFEQLSEIMREDAIIASNTSGLSITKIAESVKNPARFAGMHWFNPPHIIPLIEVIKGDKTAQETADIIYDISLKIGKKPIYVNKDVPGFIANRIQLAVMRECVYMLENGIGTAEDIDKCMKYALGFRYACIGPFEVVDFGGLDTFYHVADYLWEDLSDAKKPYGLFKKLIEEKNLGVKTGKGFYDYSGDKAKKALDRRDKLFLTLKEAKLEN